MPDTTNRPTPEQIAGQWEMAGQRRQMLVDLAEHGYVIVHPDDVPVDSPNHWGGSAFDEGWSACRGRIFGEQ